MRELSGEYPAAKLCALLGVPRSSLYYSAGLGPSEDLGPLKEAILALRVTFPGCGVRKMYHYVVRDFTRHSRSQVRRVYLELGILGKPFPRIPRTTNSKHTESRFPNLVKGLKVERPNQVWVGDVTYIRIGRRFAYLALLSDAFSRTILGWALSFHNDTILAKAALAMALESGKPEIHHTDQGSPYGSSAYLAMLGPTVKSSMAAPARPEDNGQAERLNRTVKEEEVRIAEYQTLEQARQGIREFVQKYNTQRLHQALGYRTPSQLFKLGTGTP